MDRSENINELATALAKAQGAITHASKDSTNPHFRSNYADLASVWEACRKQLSDNGLSVIQLPVECADGLLLKTMLMHSSGQYIASTFRLPVSKMDAQGYGSALTYARRYALAAIVGVYQDDDDANGAAGKQDIPRQQEASPVQQPPKAVEPELITAAQVQKLQIVAKESGLANEDMKAILAWKYKVDSSKKLSKVAASYMIENLPKIWEEFIKQQGVA